MCIFMIEHKGPMPVAKPISKATARRLAQYSLQEPSRSYGVETQSIFFKRSSKLCGSAASHKEIDNSHLGGGLTNTDTANTGQHIQEIIQQSCQLYGSSSTSSSVIDIQWRKHLSPPDWRWQGGSETVQFSSEKAMT